MFRESQAYPGVIDAPWREKIARYDALAEQCFDHLTPKIARHFGKYNRIPVGSLAHGTLHRGHMSKCG